jgi:hypothetical protein
VALLDIFKSSALENEVSVKDNAAFENIVLYSENIPADLAKVAAQYGLNVKQLDFRIVAYKTLYRRKDSPKYNELTLLEQEKFFTEENLRNPTIEIRQKIKIEIFLKDKKSRFPIKMSMGGNRELTKIVLKVPQQNNISFHSELHSELVAQIDARKARLGLLIGFMHHKSKEQIKALISDIQVNNKISKDYTISVCEGLDPVDQSNGELILHYLKNEEQEVSENDRIDHSKRDFMHTVQEGDLVLEVREFREGSHGRNCKGEVLDFSKLELSQDLDVRVSEDFRVEEEDGVTRYYALKSGFIHQSDENYFEIRDELCVDEVSFRSTGSIEADEQDIKINIEGKDVLRDAIGQGVKIETSEVRTTGNMGSGAEVIAKKVEIGGQTHQSAKIIADDVTVHLHKGIIEADVAHIAILENGKVEANKVYVEKVSGGEIIAKEVYLKEVLSNTTIYASEYIEIDILNGNGNKFIIDPKCKKDFKERVEQVEEDIESLKEVIKNKTKKIKVLRKKIQNDQENIRQINETVLSLKKRNATVPASLINKLKSNQENIKEHNLLLKELKDDKMALEKLESDLKELINAVFNAKVVNRSVWKEFNEVKFKVVEPPVEVSHLFVDGEMSEEITIKTMEDGKYVLERKKG